MRPRSAVRLALGLALLFCGCARKSSESSVTATGTDTTGTAARSESENELHQHLASTRAHLDSLREEVSAMGSSADAAVTARLARLQAVQDTAEARLARLQQATKEEWGHVESGVATLLDSLDLRVDTLRAQMHRRSH